MQCIQCDICKKFSKVWRETNFSFWKNNVELIQVKEICPECTEILETKIKEMASKF